MARRIVAASQSWPSTSRSRDQVSQLVSAGSVEDEADEAAADVAGAEVDSGAAHSWLTAWSRS